MAVRERKEGRKKACYLVITESNELMRSGGRLFFGKTKVMAKALGLSLEDEYRDGLHTLSKVTIPFSLPRLGFLEA